MIENMEKWCVILMIRESGLYIEYVYDYLELHDIEYINLLAALSDKPFRWFIDFDGNRISEVRSVRREFLRSEGIKNEAFVELEPSVLEVIYVLALRCQFQTEGDECHKDKDTKAWFWHLVGNLGLLKYTDEELCGAEVDQILNKFLDREYERNGKGGLFPLKYMRKDQRKVELWYQMSMYLMENHYDYTKNA